MNTFHPRLADSMCISQIPEPGLSGNICLSGKWCLAKAPRLKVPPLPARSPGSLRPVLPPVNPGDTVRLGMPFGAKRGGGRDR